MKSCFSHYSLLQPPAASMEADWMDISFKTSGMLKLMLKFFLIMTHYCKIFNWVLDCSLKQPPRRLGAMESPIKTSEIIMTN